MAGLSGWIMACVAILASLFFLHPLTSRIRRRNQETRPNGIEIISDPVNAKFEIVAVHGLGAYPEYAWTCDAHTTAGVPRRRIHLLRDLLTESFPDARILSFAHNSDWLINSPIKTAQEIGEGLLDQLVEHRKNREQRLPIIFMGHSFGGIIIKEALCRSAKAERIIHDTSGLLFLGTPHQGSPLSFLGAILALATGFLGSSTGLLFALQHQSAQLSDLDSRFDDVRQGLKDTRIHSIYETKPSYILGCLSIGLIVNRNSAKGPADKAIDVNTDHSGLNKCTDTSNDLYQAILGAIKEMRQRPSLLDRGDKQIRDSYTKGKLNIERLSGSSLRMDQCYINLAIVQQNVGADQFADEFGQPEFGASLPKRWRTKKFDKTLHVKLSNLFEPRRIHNEKEHRRPRRIFIRGRPGVGKTTLCKKIVHDFIHNHKWNDCFTRLLWIPLRNLQGRQERYKLKDLLHDEYFSHEDPGPILEEVYQECTRPGASSTLFLLDGLDEIWEHRSPHISGIMQVLLNQPNVIVTSRPSVQLPGDFEPFDLELETIGFYSDQVSQYVEQATRADTNMDTMEGTGKSQQILDFLDRHPVVEDLVRIPIQLDALCFAWDDLSIEEPQTMTDLYQAIETGLWRKDARRLGRTSENLPFPAELEGLVGDEIIILEKLAFAGLYKGLTVFDAKALGTLSRYLAMPGGKTIDRTLRSLSFLRSTCVSSNDANRRYYFLHLTLQEYFAARHLKRMWVDGKPFELPDAKKEMIHADAFLRRYKYRGNFNIIWRFMAGLLASSTDHQIRYFQAIQAQPLDMLGPAHHRLLMRCLFEIPPSETILRGQFEDQLLTWSAFEYIFDKSYFITSPEVKPLVSEIEFPIGILSSLWHQSDDKQRIWILYWIDVSRPVPIEIIQLALSWLKDSPNKALIEEVLPYLRYHLRSLSRGQLRVTQQKPIDENASVLNVTTSALMNQSTLLEEIIQIAVARLEGTDPAVQTAAISALEDQLNTPAILEAIVAKVEHANPIVQAAAISALEDRLNIPTVFKTIIAKVEHADPNIQTAAIRALRNQLNIPAVLEVIIAKVEHANPIVQTASIRALEDQLNIPAVLKAVKAKLKHADPVVQTAAIRALKDQLNTPTVLEAIIAKVEHTNPVVQTAAISALKHQLNTPAVLKAIVAKVEHANYFVQTVAICALKDQFNIPAVLKAVEAKLEGKNLYIQKAVIRALGGQSTLPETVLQALVAKLEDKDLYVQKLAIRALGGQSTLPETALQALVAKLEDRDNTIRVAVIMNIRSKLTGPILQAVTAKLKDDDPRVRFAAIQVLENHLSIRDIFQGVVARINDKGEGYSTKVSARELFLGQARKQPNLPEDMLQAVAAWLGYMDLWEAALEIFLQQSNLPDSVLASISSIFARQRSHDLYTTGTATTTLLSILQKSPKLLSSISKTQDHHRGLASFLLWKSFRRHLAWYHYDDKFHLIIGAQDIEYECENPYSFINEPAPKLKNNG